jgi:hypothetical protein
MKNLTAYLIIFGGLRSFVENFTALRRVGLFWLSVCLPFYWFCKTYGFYRTPNIDVNKFDWLLFKTSMTPLFVLSVAMASMAVSWHRHVLSNTRPRIVLDRAAWYYWWNGVAITLMTVIVALPVTIVVSTTGTAVDGTGKSSEYLSIITSSIIMALISYRLSLKLPAQAIGRQFYGFKHSWRDTKGESFQFIVIGTVVSCIGFVVVKIETALDQLAVYFDSYGVLFLGASIAAVLDMTFAGLGISMLTYSYVYFAEGREM